MRSLKQIIVLVIAAFLASCAGGQGPRETGAPPMMYFPTNIPVMSVDEARQVVREKLPSWRIHKSTPARNAVSGRIVSVDPQPARMEVRLSRGRRVTLALNDLGLANISGRSIEIGDYTLTGDRRTREEDIRLLADALSMLRSADGGNILPK